MNPNKPDERNKDYSEDSRKRENEEQTSPEEEPAVERGERIATGKAIARGGGKTGFVPGAQPDSERQSCSEQR